ncbi:MAG: hypothetical protein NZ959_04745 [Armatimonadetes bacterium]|nr:hypothetical protein [Armatimonadota bacterium]MDW8120881.1 inositol monophosphatase family protein [Armatimonadota bacterium]
MDRRLISLPLNAVALSLRKLKQLGSSATAVVEKRSGPYRSWDPEVLRIDKMLEEAYLSVVPRLKRPILVLTEEAGEVTFGNDSVEAVVFCDPFDGSALYRRGIPAFWYTALGVYSPDGKPISAAVGDGLTFQIVYTDGRNAYQTNLDTIRKKVPVQPSDIKDLKDAYLATYLMKPHFLYPTVERFKKLFQAVKMVIPNGGPAGFADVASGKCDIYLAIRQPVTEVFSALPIALAAGCVVTDFMGEPVQMVTDINQRLDIIACANADLHAQVLAVVKRG